MSVAKVSVRNGVGLTAEGERRDLEGETGIAAECAGLLHADDATLHNRAARDREILPLIDVLRHGRLEGLATLQAAAIERLRGANAEERTGLDGERRRGQMRRDVRMVLAAIGSLAIALLAVACCP